MKPCHYCTKNNTDIAIVVIVYDLVIQDILQKTFEQTAKKMANVIRVICTYIANELYSQTGNF